MLTMEQFRQEMEQAAQTQTSAHFNGEFNVAELGESERATYEVFLATDWSNPAGHQDILEAIKGVEAAQLNQSQKTFYHWLRNVIQVKMLEHY